MAAGRDPVRLLMNIRSGIYCVNRFATTMKMEELPEILEHYQVPVTADVEEEVLTMCNLGEGVYEKGMKAGRLQGQRDSLDRTGRLIKATTHAGRLQEFLDSVDDGKRITALFEEFDIK